MPTISETRKAAVERCRTGVRLAHYLAGDALDLLDYEAPEGRPSASKVLLRRSFQALDGIPVLLDEVADARVRSGALRAAFDEGQEVAPTDLLAEYLEALAEAGRLLQLAPHVPIAR